ncbi:lipopolysaccharide assembly protein LapA domain-containing protein [Limnohabitans sp.]|uniref:lipopolysaccharide assembly protein LapA domain-containing protein n=1 Tax=Limnohabitans sp. TaxID=1907725 RepID=UPI00286FAD04|nr:lipopolysaccharide assembly protein LapA domain-containing protein [Limnohabitans sp.]
MKNLMWLLQLLLKAAIFFTLFAFALNNQHDAVVHFFFGTTWSAPLVLVLLTVFVMGVAVGVIGMVPRWWKHRRLAQLASTSTSKPTVSAPSSADPTHGI